MASGNFCLHSVRTFNSWFSKRFISLHAHQRVHSRLQILPEKRFESRANRILFLTRNYDRLLSVVSVTLFPELNLFYLRVCRFWKGSKTDQKLLLLAVWRRGFEDRGVVFERPLLGCPHPLCICITIQPLLCIIILKCSINEGQLPEGTMPLGLSSKIQNGSGEIKRYWEVLLRAPRGREKANPCWIFRNSIMMTTKKRKIVCEIYM